MASATEVDVSGGVVLLSVVIRIYCLNGLHNMRHKGGFLVAVLFSSLFLNLLLEWFVQYAPQKCIFSGGAVLLPVVSHSNIAASLHEQFGH